MIATDGASIYDGRCVTIGAEASVSNASQVWWMLQAFPTPFAMPALEHANKPPPSITIVPPVVAAGRGIRDTANVALH